MEGEYVTPATVVPAYSSHSLLSYAERGLIIYGNGGTSQGLFLVFSTIFRTGERTGSGRGQKMGDGRWMDGGVGGKWLRLS